MTAPRVRSQFALADPAWGLSGVRDHGRRRGESSAALGVAGSGRAGPRGMAGAGRAAHRHAYELAPTAAELRTWHREVTELATLLSAQAFAAGELARIPAG